MFFNFGRRTASVGPFVGTLPDWNVGNYGWPRVILGLFRTKNVVLVGIRGVMVEYPDLIGGNIERTRSAT